MDTTKLTDFRMHDGSRWFASLPMSVYPRELAEYLTRLPTATVTKVLSAMPADGSWIDFSYVGHSFTINDQYGEYWFIVDDPACPDAVLNAVIDYSSGLLLKST